MKEGFPVLMHHIILPQCSTALRRVAALHRNMQGHTECNMQRHSKGPQQRGCQARHRRDGVCQAAQIGIPCASTCVTHKWMLTMQCVVVPAHAVLSPALHCTLPADLEISLLLPPGKGVGPEERLVPPKDGAQASHLAPSTQLGNLPSCQKLQLELLHSLHIMECTGQA